MLVEPAREIAFARSVAGSPLPIGWKNITTADEKGVKGKARS